MPDQTGQRDIGAAFSDQLGGQVSFPSRPFGLGACPGNAWIISGLVTLGVLIALGFAVFNSGGDSGSGSDSGFGQNPFENGSGINLGEFNNFGNGTSGFSGDFSDFIDDETQQALDDLLNEARR